jgi:hypothetical protein
VSRVSSTVESSRAFHSKNMTSFSSAKTAYSSAVQNLVNATKAALDPQRYYAYAAKIGAAVVAAVTAYSDPDALVAAASGAYGRVAARAPVSRALELADPLIAAGQTKYNQAHDKLVVRPRSLEKGCWGVFAGETHQRGSTRRFTTADHPQPTPPPTPIQLPPHRCSRCTRRCTTPPPPSPAR